MRLYRTVPGVWGFAVGRSPFGWHLQFAVWVITTEPY